VNACTLEWYSQVCLDHEVRDLARQSIDRSARFYLYSERVLIAILDSESYSIEAVVFPRVEGNFNSALSISRVKSLASK